MSNIATVQKLNVYFPTLSLFIGWPSLSFALTLRSSCVVLRPLASPHGIREMDKLFRLCPLRSNSLSLSGFLSIAAATDDRALLAPQSKKKLA